MSAVIGACGVPYRAFAEARVSDTLAMSELVMEGLTDVMHRPGFARSINARLRDDVLDRLRTSAIWFAPEVTVTVCRDPTDDKYLELALPSAGTIIQRRSGPSDPEPLAWYSGTTTCHLSCSYSRSATAARNRVIAFR